MDDPEYDIHPLDRDYSDDLLPKSKRRSIIKRKLPFNERSRLGGVIIFLVGVGVMVASAIVLVNSKGASSFESFANLMHQLGMWIMLIGAIVVMAAYQSKP